MAEFLKRLGWFTLVLALQVLVFDHVHILGRATPFVAVYFVLLFPGDSPRSAILAWSFALGLIADTFTNTPGVAAVSLTATAMLQPWLLRINSQLDDDNETPIASAKAMGWRAYIIYVSAAVVVCELLFCSLETFSFFNWAETLANAGCGSLLTVLIIAAVESVRTGGRRKTE